MFEFTMIRDSFRSTVTLFAEGTWYTISSTCNNQIRGEREKKRHRTFKTRSLIKHENYSSENVGYLHDAYGQWQCINVTEHEFDFDWINLPLSQTHIRIVTIPHLNWIYVQAGRLIHKGILWDTHHHSTHTSKVMFYYCGDCLWKWLAGNLILFERNREYYILDVCSTFTKS